MTYVVLKNNTKHPKRMLTFHLTGIAAVKVTNRVTVESRDGERRQKTTSKLVPDSVRIAHGETSGPLPEAVLLLPDVAKAVAKREVIVQAAPKDAGPKPQKPPAPAADAPAEEPKGKERKRRA